MEAVPRSRQGRKSIQLEFEDLPIGEDALVISVKGELCLATVEELKEPAEAAISDRRVVILDLSECPFIDSTGLRLTLQLHNGRTNGTGPGAALAIVANPRIRKFFSLTAIDRSVEVFATRGEALEALDAGGGNAFVRR